MTSYYLRQVMNLVFPESGKLVTKQQMAIEGFKVDDDPRTVLEVVSKDYYKGYWKLLFTHEVTDREPRRLGGDPAYVDRTIKGGDKAHDVFYSPEKELMILKAPKNLVNGLIRVLRREYPSSFNLNVVPMDFPKIIERAQSNIIGSWFSGIKGQVNSVGIFGDRVNLDTSFGHYKNLGQISALYLELYYDDKSKPITVTITRLGGIILYTPKSNDIEELDFIFSLIEKLDLWP